LGAPPPEALDPSGSDIVRRGDLRRLAQRRPALELRAAVIRELRASLERAGSLEVETPTRVRTPGTDLHLDPIAAEDHFLITSPEFHMKRLVGAGYGRIHQICRCYRAGEVGALHNPEFTMLEWYRAGASYLDLAAELEALVAGVAVAVCGTTRLEERGVELAPPWQRLTVREAFEQFAGWAPGPHPDPDRFFLDLVEKVEPHLGAGRPTILLEYPLSQAVLARVKPGDPDVALRFEAYVDGVELVNAFDELTDAVEQRQRFEEDNRARQRTGKPALPIDEALLGALAAMPPTAGAALGVDRLVMLLAGARSLDEVMAFTEPWM
jgi:elongation factor P--(R)-beta-lysine ligase